MSLSRSFLKSLSLNDDQISAVIEAHSETVNALNTKYSELESRYNSVKESADRLPAVQKELDDLMKLDYKSKYDAEKSAHDSLKETLARKEAHAAREKAVRAYYEGKNIRNGNLAIAMRGTDIDSLQLDDDGALTDTAALDALVEGDFKPLVSTSRRTISSGADLSPRTEHNLNPSDVMNNILRGKQ